MAKERDKERGYEELGMKRERKKKREKNIRMAKERERDEELDMKRERNRKRERLIEVYVTGPSVLSVVVMQMENCSTKVLPDQPANR